MAGQGRRNWPLLIVALALAGAFALSIHVVMLEFLGVAYPEDGATPAWARLLNNAGTVIAMLAFYRLARPSLERQSWPARVLILFALLAMVKETARGVIMDGVVSTGWAFAVLKEVPSLVVMLAIAVAVVAIGPRLKGWLAVLLGGVVVTGAIFLGLQPAVGAAYGPWLQSMSYLGHADLYQLPYPVQVMVPAYLTFAEPVAACAVMAAMSWRGLSANPVVRLAQFTALIAFLKGVVVRTVVFSSFIKLPIVAAVLSESQFALEFLALAALTCLVWQRWGEGRPGAA